MKKHKASSSRRRQRNNSNAADAKPAAPPPAAVAAAGRTGGRDGARTVVMPVEFLRWFLAQRSEDYRVPALEDYSPADAADEKIREKTVRRVNDDVQATKDDFAAFRAWVRGVVVKDGRVVLGHASNPRELQEIIDGEWAEARRELGVGGGHGGLAGSDGDAGKGDGGEGAMASETRVPRGPHLQTLSIYLSLIYQRMT